MSVRIAKLQWQDSKNGVTIDCRLEIRVHPATNSKTILLLLFWFETVKDANGNPARQFRYQVAHGGLVVDAEPYPYQAPETGYESEWDWFYEPSGRHANENLADLLKKKFYVKLRSGKIYGAITWHWAAESSVGFSGYLNPTGSRNLEPDPEKLITDPEEIRRLDEATRVK